MGEKILKVGEATNMHPNSNQQQFSLSRISKIKDYSIVEIRERELMSERFYILIIDFFDYFHKSLIVFLLHQ